MSRIGKRPIPVPKTVKISCENKQLQIQGPKGSLSFVLPEQIEAEIQPEVLQLTADFRNDMQSRMLMGTAQSILRGMVIGVSEGFKKQLNLVGVGYKAAVTGNKLELSLGYSHPINFVLPEGVKASVQGNNVIVLESCDKQLLGQVAANLRSLRPPEPYKGKGVIVAGEVIRRKVGKTGKTGKK